MCTAIAYNGKGFYFGRNLDYEHGFGEQIVITPRGYSFNFRRRPPVNTHYSIIGIASVRQGFPLYYDAANEKGLCIAGLNFVGNASYGTFKSGADNIAHFEIIPYILSQCATVKETHALLQKVNITDEPFSNDTPPASLHWIIADKNGCIVLECMKDGLHIYENPIGVLTNNPPFPFQLFALNNFLGLSVKNPAESNWGGAALSPYSRGMGAFGLPGDLSSQSRFIRAAFVKSFSQSGDASGDTEQFFHILDSVKQVRGCTVTDDGKYEYTLYSSCFNEDKKTYCVTTYDNREIRSYYMYDGAVSPDSLTVYPLHD